MHLVCFSDMQKYAEMWILKPAVYKKITLEYTRCLDIEETH